LAGEGIYRFLLRMPEELRERLSDAASSSGRSLNKEIVERLEVSLAAPAEIVSSSGEEHMRFLRNRRAALVLAATFAVLAAAVAGLVATGRTHTASKQTAVALKIAGKEVSRSSQGGTANGGSGGEAANMFAAQQQWDNTRTAGSIVAPGAYSDAFNALQTGIGVKPGTWEEITRVPYDADSPAYRDYYSNSSGGAGLVTGRITALAVGNDGVVYAGGADGGVWRSTSGTGDWHPIADSLPSLSSGDLQLDRTGALWYGTGEANTGGTSYVGSGVYRLSSPQTGSFSVGDRIGGTELESTTIYHLRFSGDTVYAATLRGVYSHSIGGTASTPWARLFSPSPTYLPGGTQAGEQNAAYKNIVNDVAVDPKNAKHLIAAAGWRGGDSYNGFYESKDSGATWTKVNPGGAINPNDIGYATFAYAGDGSKLYAINESVKLYNQLTGTKAYNTLLDGIYVSNTGNPAGPWSKIAESTKLANSGSALKQSVGGKGYGPGVQAWYNQFLGVDPSNPNHVYAGLEEVYETQNAGANWTTTGPYWNFYFSCWRPDSVYPPNSPAKGCPLEPHSDQHAVAFGNVGGKSYVYVGNDGGVYRRPTNGTVNANGNGTDWQSLNDGTLDALQYYYVGAGTLKDDDALRPNLTSGDKVLVSGGLQDNGGSLVRPNSGSMVSNFGGDGGDVLVDPADGCNIVQEYVYLSMRMTKTCANPGEGHPNAFLDLSDATTKDIAPPDVNAQFIAPFTANEKSGSGDQWLAAGTSLWYQDKGFDIASGADWQKVYSLPSATQTFTAVAYDGNRAIATWCGPCSNSGTATFARGAVVGTFDPVAKTWLFTPVTFPAAFPNRYLQGAAINPNDQDDLFVGVNGFSRRFSEGPGAGVGHVYESKDAGATWVDISANFPDIPVNDVVSLTSGGLVAATDLGVLYRAPGATNWQRLGSNLPTTTVMDLSVGPDGNLYVGTQGRGIWRIPSAGL
jgi:hypothetical protein